MDITKSALNDFKDIHSGKDIYVIASGKSLDYLNTDFFDNKITIGVNQVFKKLQCTHYLRKEHALINEALDATNPESFIFVCNSNAGAQAKLNKMNYSTPSRIIPFDHYHFYPVDTKQIKANMFDKSEDKLVITYSTITSAIHLAHYMGAKNIILVGHDCCKLNNECNYTNYHTKETRGVAWGMGQDAIDKYTNWLKQIENMTIHIKKILQKHYNVNVLSLNPFINFNLEGVIKS
jgi:hypothetical protein